jgi:hypothetical protein
MTDFDILGAASSGMQAQRAAMDVQARNVALAQTGDARHPAYGLVPDVAAVLVPLLAPTIWVLALSGLLLIFMRPLKRLLSELGPGVPESAPAAPPPPAAAASLPHVSPEAVFRALADEPPHTAATVIAGLSTPDAAAVLDLYPAAVRREIIGRLARPRTPLAADLSGTVRNV